MRWAVRLGFLLLVFLLMWIGAKVYMQMHQAPSTGAPEDNQSSVCTYQGARYSEGALIRTSKGTLKCHAREWVKP